MSSEKPKPERAKKEEELYAPILLALQDIFDRYYVAKPVNFPLQSVPVGWLKNPHLEITAHGELSETLQNEFDPYMFRALYAENLKPDIMGFVKRKPSSKPEFITVEVKAGAITIRDVLQAKLYEDIFNAKFSFVISPEGISPKKLKVILEHDKAIRGNVIIVSYNPGISRFRVNPELKSLVREPFQIFCK